jgi:twinkle protein
MRYLISAQQQLPSPNYQTCTVKESLDYLNSLDEIAVDTETLGFDPYTCALISIQLGDRNNQYFIDTGTINIQQYKTLLETKLLVMQNGKFDLRFLYHNRIVPSRIYDTYLAERTLYLGIDSHRAGLDSLCMEYLGIMLDKEERKNISARLTESLIVYGCKDVEYLLEIKRIQQGFIKEKGLEVSIELDNRFVKVLAYIEYCGIKLDAEKWKAKIESAKKEMVNYKNLLDEFIRKNNMKEFINFQGDLFNSELSVVINWNSPKQVIRFFNLIGVNTKVKDKGEYKDTVEQGHLIKFAKKFPIIETYCKYKECQKDLSTYGENWFKLINPVSGRVHTQFKQLMNTGRLSSGGKDKIMKVELPNMQNIPSDEETRSCFVADKGNLLIGVDYSGQEQVVLANRSMDRNLLEFYDKGLGDMHSFVASKMHRELEGLTLDEIKKKHKDKRQAAKVAGFAIGYGGSPTAIADQLQVSEEQAQEVYNGYFEAFPGLKEYFDKTKQEGLKNGYVLISPETGKKCYINYYEEFLEVQKEFTKDFWTRYRKLKEKGFESPTFLEMKDKVSKYFTKKGEIERMSLNYPIQGSSAEITKLSAVYFWDEYLVPNNLLFIVKFVNVIHDENLIEAPEELTEEACKELIRCMEKSGEKFCKRVPLKAEPAIATYWKK